MNSKYLIFSGMGIELVVLMVGSAYFGEIADRWANSRGIFVAVFCIASLVGWITQIIILARRFEKDDDNPSQN